MSTIYYPSAAENSLADSQPREAVSAQQNKRRLHKTLAVGAAVILLSVLGILVCVGVYHVARTTAQEKLAAQHSQEVDGPYPLRAIVFDNRRGMVRDLAPQAKYQPPKPVDSNSENATQYIVILHGIKSTAELWLPMLEKWAQGTTSDVVFILPDLLGHGKSAWPKDIKYDPLHHVASLRALLERIVPAGADLHIAGHSLGAILSLELAGNLLQYSADPLPSWNVKTLTLMSTPYYRSKNEAETAAHRHSFWFRHQQFAHLFCGYLFCRQNWLWKRPLRRKFCKLYPKLPHTVFEAALQHSHYGVESCIRHCVIQHRAHKAAEQVRLHGLPTLLIDAENDELCKQSRQTLAHALSPFCTAILLRNANHDFVARRIDETLCHMKSFVEASALLDDAAHETQQQQQQQKQQQQKQQQQKQQQNVETESAKTAAYLSSNQ